MYETVQGKILTVQVYVFQKRAAGRTRLTFRSSQGRGLRLATRNCDVCSIHAWNVGVSKRRLLRF